MSDEVKEEEIIKRVGPLIVSLFLLALLPSLAEGVPSAYLAFAVTFLAAFAAGGMLTRNLVLGPSVKARTSQIVAVTALIILVTTIDLPALQTSIAGLLSGSIAGAAILGYRGSRR